jgi:hypothetical protein
MKSQHSKKNLGAVMIAVESEIFPEEVRQLLDGKSKNIYRVLFAIRATTVYVSNRVILN